VKTIIARSGRRIGGALYPHGSEIPPSLLSDDELASMLDNGELIEYDSSERRSLYRLFAPLFAPFSGCTEQESLTQEELDQLALS
jgi:hypothetical protein